MLSWLIVIGTCLLIVLIFCIFNIFDTASNRKKLPPFYGGWIPWLGCALEFGKNPLRFINLMGHKLGPVYTLKVAGERMTFLTDAKDFHNFFQSTNVDFQKAVQSSVQKIASVTEKAFFKNHTKIHDTVKGRLSFHKLPPFCETLHSKFKEHLVGVKNQITIKNGCEFEAELNDLVRSTMYKSIMDNLFGDGVLPTHDEATFKEFENNFLIFDEQFEYAARLPKIFLREWTKSKNWLLQMFTRVTKQCMQTIPADVESRSLLQTLLAVIDDDFSPNWSMMMLWASLANAIPITFWTLCMIYQHPRVLEKVQSEVRQVLKENEKCKSISCDESTLALMPYTRQCILEAIRLRSPGIFTRRVIKEFRVKGYNIPVGDLLMVSPFWAHRNSQQFPDPEEFKPERWENIEKNSFPESFIAFGGGRYQCPGSKLHSPLATQNNSERFLKHVKHLNCKFVIARSGKGYKHSITNNLLSMACLSTSL